MHVIGSAYGSVYVPDQLGRNLRVDDRSRTLLPVAAGTKATAAQAMVGPHLSRVQRALPGSVACRAGEYLDPPSRRPVACCRGDDRCGVPKRRHGLAAMGSGHRRACGPRFHPVVCAQPPASRPLPLGAAQGTPQRQGRGDGLDRLLPVLLVGGGRLQVGSLSSDGLLRVPLGSADVPRHFRHADRPPQSRKPQPRARAVALHPQ